MNARLVLLLVAGFLPAAEKLKDDPVEKEMEPLLGRWRFVAANEAANDAKPAGAIVFTKDKLMIRLPGAKEATAHPFEIKPGADPKQLDVMHPDAMTADARRLGIYSIEKVGKKDQLKICLALCFNQERPKDFSQKRDNEVFVLERDDIWW